MVGDNIDDSDDVYPVFLMDDLKANFNVMSRTMRFNDILDPDKLNKALCRLFELGDWRKCGGRLHLKRDGKHEIRVPKAFTKERPATTFTQLKFDMNIEDHPTASLLPQSTSEVSTQALGPDVLRLANDEDAPARIPQLEKNDRPQFSLHVTSFENATVVALSWPHTMADGGASSALAKAWSNVLAGREDLVPKVLGAKDDVLEKLDRDIDSHYENRIIKDSAMSLLQKVTFGGRMGFSILTGANGEDKSICIPKKTADRLIADAKADFATRHSDDYITSGDILSAWGAKTYAQAHDYARPMTVVQVLDARSSIPELRRAGEVYLQNMLQTIYITLPIEILKGPLSEIAWSYRKQSGEQRTEKQVRSLVYDARKALKAGSQPEILYGAADALVLPINNLNKIGYFENVNFGPAVVKTGDRSETRVNPPGTMVSWFNKPLDYEPMWLELLHLTERDHAGNQWMKGVFRPYVWKVFERELDRLEQA